MASGLHKVSRMFSSLHMISTKCSFLSPIGWIKLGSLILRQSSRIVDGSNKDDSLLLLLVVITQLDRRFLGREHVTLLQLTTSRACDGRGLLFRSFHTIVGIFPKILAIHFQTFYFLQHYYTFLFHSVDRRWIWCFNSLNHEKCWINQKWQYDWSV